MLYDALGQQLINGLSAGMTYALIALGLTMIFGVLHVINFAHGELYMAGGMATVLLVQYLGIPYLLAIPLAVIVAGLISWGAHELAVEPFLDRSDGLSTVLLATYAVHLLILNGVVSTWGPVPLRIDGITGTAELSGVILSYQRIFVLSVGFALVIGIELLLRRTQLGRELRAMAQDAFAARVIGIRVRSVRTLAFVIAGMLAAVAGSLIVPISLFTPFMGEQVIIKAFVVVVIGGMGSASGAVICGIGIGILEAVLGSYLSSGVALALIYSLLIFVLLLRPQGLFGTKTDTGGR
jgi:branched-chain amino acid transport system permease protein